ncbi:hypothetical protein [Deinococcus humi]|uniref:Leucine rich repeat variant n=1 Tax=Deinococcus humi TaxID=662880 RepID=A0A7W8JVQ1_9DEIO|nr:hypothetical protein [Deinococcus humi]MBB5362514.1 hypothetical protein [Deinococcus humi]GGO28439.1 hypothetical protein GCM10008949_21070 [Deinococcus humi]
MPAASLPLPADGLPAPDATSAELLRLVHGAPPHVLEAVARHPNTPVTLLGELALGYAEAVLDNPALPLLRLAQAGHIRAWSGLAVSRLAAVDTAPEWVQELAMRHPDRQARWAVAGRARLSQERLAQLANREEWQLRAAVAQHPDLSEELVGRLSTDHEYGVRLALSARPDLPPHVLDRLRKDPHPLIRRRLQMHTPPMTGTGR